MKSSVVVNGVVVIHVLKDGKPLDLQCNEGATTRKVLPSGSYLMLQLPENHGMYDCKNVEMYRGDQDKPKMKRLAPTVWLRIDSRRRRGTDLQVPGPSQRKIRAGEIVRQRPASNR